MTQTLSLDLGERSYDIHIGKALIDKIGELIPMDLKSSNVFILYDKNVYPYVQVIEEALAQNGVDTKNFAVKGGEPTKSYNGYYSVMNWLLEGGVTRNSVLMAVGGGVVGDLGGFAAATVMRGIPFVQVPTTLLAQVDSSVGGKTGINTAQGKNLVGAFYQPKSVICDLGTLGTLPERELKSGYAEIVKYGLINDLEFFEWLEENGEKVLSLDEDAISYAIYKSCEAKAKIVAEDEREKGQRALLNLGHTFGHALEAAANYDGRLLHGEAVSIGMVLAFKLSVSMGLCSHEDSERVQDYLKSCGLKTKISDISPKITQSAEYLWDNMTRDKKALNDKIGFILTRGIGQAFQSFDVEKKLVLRILDEGLES